jgi:hypothetical protein
MQDEEFIPLVGGRYEHYKVVDPSIRMHEEDRVQITDGNRSDYYLIGCDGKGKPTNPRKKVYGSNWIIRKEDLKR